MEKKYSVDLPGYLKEKKKSRVDVSWVDTPSDLTANDEIVCACALVLMKTGSCPKHCLLKWCNQKKLLPTDSVWALFYEEIR